jgi:hypothetical protein
MEELGFDPTSSRLLGEIKLRLSESMGNFLTIIIIIIIIV